MRGPLHHQLILILLLLTATIDASGDLYGDLCVVVNPLRTPFFNAWLEKNINTRGCAVPVVSSSFFPNEVHYIRVLEPPGNDVTVDIDGDGATRRLVLVLDSDVTTRWTVRASGSILQSRHNIIVERDSEVHRSDLRASVTRRQGDERVSLLHFVKRRYKNVASFTQVAGANRVRLKLQPLAGDSQAAGDPTSCDYNSTAANPAASAWNSNPQNVEGCFHSDAVGVYPKDVHIIDLAWNERETSNRLRDVQLHLKSSSSDVVEQRDVVLVLKSSLPVRWILTADETIAGTLTVISEHIVDNGGISARQTLQVRSQSVAENFALLILTVTGEFGPPISYVKPAAGSNRLQLVVGKKNPNVKVDMAASHNSPYAEMGVRSLERGASATPRNKHAKDSSAPINTRRSAGSTLRQSLRINCAPSQMTITLPRTLGDSLGVSQLWFSDKSCSAQRNATHWLLSSPMTSCGSTSSSDGKLTTFSNTVFVQLGPAVSDDEDFEGSGMMQNNNNQVRHVAVPVQCQYEPSFPLAGFDMADDDNVLDPVEVSDGQMNLYHMEVYRDKDFTNPVMGDSMTLARDAEVLFNEFVHVKTWIDGVSFIKIVMEKCWVSNSSDPEQAARLVLIHNTCPAHLSVQLLDSKSENSRAFTFQVSRDYADSAELYVHCKLGLCTNDMSRSQGNLKRCVDPSQYCSGGHVLKPFLENSISSAQQILVRGPMRMVLKLTSPSTRHVESGSRPDSSVRSKENNSPSSQVMVVGVSTEIAVGIALASFVIGVGLTALLWWIHLRTDPYRRVKTGEGPQCSAPMLGTTDANFPLSADRRPSRSAQQHYSNDCELSSSSRGSPGTSRTGMMNAAA